MAPWSPSAAIIDARIGVISVLRNLERPVAHDRPERRESDARTLVRPARPSRPAFNESRTHGAGLMRRAAADLPPPGHQVTIKRSNWLSRSSSRH